MAMIGAFLLIALLADPDPRAILERVSAAVKNLTTRQITAQMSVETKGPVVRQHLDAELIISAAAGGKFRIETKSIGPMLAVSDGKSNWIYFPFLKKYSISAAQPHVPEFENLGAWKPGADLTEHLVSARFIREESVDVGGEQVPCYVIQAEYQQPGSTTNREIWIDKNREVPVREESTTRTELPGASSVLETAVKMKLTSLKLNGFIPDSEFTFTPPEGATAMSTPQSDPYRVGAGVTAPTLLYKVDPRYSEEARQAKIEGAVMLYVVVGADGIPRDMRVTRSLGHGLDENAIAAVAQWRFKPGQKEGKPVAVAATIEVNFRLLDKAPDIAGKALIFQ